MERQPHQWRIILKDTQSHIVNQHLEHAGIDVMGIQVKVQREAIKELEELLQKQVEEQQQGTKNACKISK